MRRAGTRYVVAVVLIVVTAVSTIAGSAAPPGFDAFAPPEPLGAVAVAAVLPVSHWENLYLDGWDDQHTAAYLPLSRSPDSWDHYNLSYGVDQNTAMYRATGRTRYLDRALEYVTNVVASAQPARSLPTSRHRDRYLGWTSARPGVDGDEVPLYESYFWRYATALLRVLRHTPALYDDAAYRERYDRLLQFAEVHVFEKWYRRGPHETIYRSRTHMAAHWAAIALNLALITADPMRRNMYRAVVDDIDQHLPNHPSCLRGQLTANPVEPTAYFWSDVWGSTRRPGQDVGHGNGVISYVVEARDHGAHWTPTDMARFTALLTVIWPRGRDYREYVDGTGNGNGWFADGFVKLGRYNAAAQQRLERHKVVNHQYLANLALNSRILRGAAT